jgi:L-malate glycosyltransferase
VSSKPPANQRLNVLFVTSWYPSEQHPLDGIFIREYAKAVSLKHNVAVFYPSMYPIARQHYDDEGIPTLKTGLYYRLRGPKILRYLIMALAMLRYLWRGMRDITKMRRTFHPDLIHLHIVYPAGLIALFASIRYRIPLILSEQTNPFSVYMTNPPKRWLIRRVMHRARVITSISGFLQRQLEHYGATGPFDIVPNVVDTDLFTATPSPSVANRPKRIVLIALLDYPTEVPDIKGINYLLQALARLRQQRTDFTLDIIGDGPKREEYEVLTISLNLTAMVRFLGMKPKPEVANLLPDYDFLVLSSLTESLGVAVIEALASGKPVVSTRCGGPEEIITPVVGRLVDKASAEALCEGVDWMLDHYQDFDPQTIAAYARDRYSYAAIAAQFDAVYQRALRAD